MSDVKIIPITPAYRQNYERIFQRQETQEDWERPNGGRSYVSRGSVNNAPVGSREDEG